MSAERLPSVTLLGYADLGAALGVSTNQVWTWAQRRDANGFPEPADYVRWGRTRRPRYDLDAVVAWREQYVPSKAPRRHRRQAHGDKVVLPDGQVGPLPQGWLTLSEIAVEFGMVPKRTWNWAYRRGTNGFPAARGHVVTDSGERRDVFDIDDVREWRRMYRPGNRRSEDRGR